MIGTGLHREPDCYCSGGIPAEIAVSSASIDRSVVRFHATPRKMLLGGQWVDAACGKAVAMLDPATGDVLAGVRSTGQWDAALDQVQVKVYVEKG